MTGLVLAGGRSRRMGRDKALLEVAGEALILRVGRVLEDVCDRVLVATGEADRYEVGWEQVPDVSAGNGPLAGILAGLEAADSDLVAVVAVDMPYANAGVLELLADEWMGEAAVVPLVDDRVQPLHGVYATSAAPSFRRLVEDGKRSVVPALSDLGARVVGPDVWGEVDPEGRFARNVNRPEDLDDLIDLDDLDAR
ncbi:MAG: molybdenum cofactor guanylyltransferase [Actinobacteria bacterium]|nr:molybdenum cofactor guanylyltransferase [Actinomycetota bacterium]